MRRALPCEVCSLAELPGGRRTSRVHGREPRRVEKPGWRIRPAVLWRDVCAFRTGAQTCQTTARLCHPRLFFMGFCGPKAHEDRLQATDPAPAEVPSGWLTLSVLDNNGIIAYNYPVRSDKALGACRVRYARKSSFVFVRTSCLWFLPPSAVEKSRSGGTQSRPRPSRAGRMPEGGGGLSNVSTPQLIDCKIEGTKPECL
jgi:hypothetical protein